MIRRAIDDTQDRASNKKLCFVEMLYDNGVGFTCIYIEISGHHVC